MATSEKEISSGTIGKDVWIGRHSPYYDCANQRFKGRDVHILRFSVTEARAVIEMLEKEIERQTLQDKLSHRSAIIEWIRQTQEDK